ncbi:MAG: hypothetical protein OXU20_05090 [Myxococcales bacterium]|nr:hypothetical protein [Myxococcales bacterium]MDD9971322.1 hypothetical protein [Myxococcales bacterium]
MGKRVRQLGLWLGGNEGRTLMEQADETMRRQGVLRPDLIAAMVALTLPPLTSTDRSLTQTEAVMVRDDG